MGLVRCSDLPEIAMEEENSRRDQGQSGQKEEAELHVDEDWKKSVVEERERLGEEQVRQRKQQVREQAVPKELPAPDFRVFVAGLYTQTLMALGEVENPVTKEKGRDLSEAQYLIDTIDMLRLKTQGNLSSEEEGYLSSLLNDLRMRYVDAAGQPAKEGQDKPQ